MCARIDFLLLCFDFVGVVLSNRLPGIGVNKMDACTFIITVSGGETTHPFYMASSRQR
jgi:hypothetical protein